jgi:hypothetical protein
LSAKVISILWSIFLKPDALLRAADVMIAISVPVGAEAVRDAAADGMDVDPAVKVEVGMVVADPVGMVADAMGADQDVIVRAVKIAIRHPPHLVIPERLDSFPQDWVLQQNPRVHREKSVHRSHVGSKSLEVASQGLLADQRVPANCDWC